MKDPRLKQQLITPDYRENQAPFSFSDDQMMTLLTERVGHVAACVSGADNMAQQEAAVLKVASFCKIWLENMERDMRGK